MRRPNLTSCLAIAALLLALPSAIAARVIYIDADATGANNGSSWADAYNCLQDALADANSAPKPVEIRVAEGIYKPDQGAGITVGDRRATFQLINGVTMRGGYAGLGEPDPNARDINVYTTTLSGDLVGNDIHVDDPGDLPGETTRSENSRTVVVGSGTDTTAILDGFVIMGGHYDVYVWGSRGSAAGMQNTSGSPHITNCTFAQNWTISGAGSGMRNWRKSSPTVINCTFKHNAAGGIFNYDSDPTVIRCTFSHNSGGGMSNDSGNATLTRCKFIGNFGWAGGGMFNHHSSPVLTDCLFVGNRAYYSPERFSGHGGAMCNSSYSHPVVTNSTFSENSAERNGGAIYSRCSSARFTNCTVARGSAGAGKAVACDSWRQEGPSNIQIANCIFWDGGEEIWNNDGSTIKISYSNLRSGQAGAHDPCEGLVWGDGNMEADPLFADPDNEDYHLKSQAGRWDPASESWVKDDVTSPCIDAGDPMSPIGYEPFPNGGRINMGAYGGTAEASKSYFGEPVCETIVAGDINGDCKVDLIDFAIMASHWLEDNTPVNSNSVLKDGIEYYIQTDKFVYQLGENVEILYRVTNASENPVDIESVLNCDYGWVRLVTTDDSNNIVWINLRHPPPCGWKTIHLGPLEDEEYREVWNMMNDNGTDRRDDDFPIATGRYNVIGGLGACEEVPVKVSIGIRP